MIAVEAERVAVRIPAREVRWGDVVVFSGSDRSLRPVAAIATQVATFFNPGRGIPHGCLLLYWEGDENNGGYAVAPNHVLTVLR